MAFPLEGFSAVFSHFSDVDCGSKVMSVDHILWIRFKSATKLIRQQWSIKNSARIGDHHASVNEPPLNER